MTRASTQGLRFALEGEARDILAARRMVVQHSYLQPNLNDAGQWRRLHRGATVIDEWREPIFLTGGQLLGTLIFEIGHSDNASKDNKNAESIALRAHGLIRAIVSDNVACPYDARDRTSQRHSMTG